MFHRLLAVELTAVLLVSQPVKAELSATSLGACASVQGDLARLQCYDDLARKLGVAPASGPAAGESEWQMDTETNPVDDSKTIVLRVTAKNSRSRFGEPFTLYLRCMSGKTAAIILWNEFLGNDEARVTVRFGTEPATTQAWPISNDKKASFAPGDPIGFVRKLGKVKQFIAQVTPYNENPVTAIFNTSGLAEAVQPLAATCRWKL